MNREEERNGRVQILGIRWLLKQQKRVGRLASTLVICMREKVGISEGLRIERTIFPVETGAPYSPVFPLN